MRADAHRITSQSLCFFQPLASMPMGGAWQAIGCGGQAMACASGMLRLFDSLHTSVQRKSISRWAVKNAVGKKLLHRAPPFNKSPPPLSLTCMGGPGLGVLSSGHWPTESCRDASLRLALCATPMLNAPRSLCQSGCRGRAPAPAIVEKLATSTRIKGSYRGARVSAEIDGEQKSAQNVLDSVTLRVQKMTRRPRPMPGVQRQRPRT